MRLGNETYIVHYDNYDKIFGSNTTLMKTYWVQATLLHIAGRFGKKDRGFPDASDIISTPLLSLSPFLRRLPVSPLQCQETIPNLVSEHTNSAARGAVAYTRDDSVCCALCVTSISPRHTRCNNVITSSLPPICNMPQTGPFRDNSNRNSEYARDTTYCLQSAQASTRSARTCSLS